MYFGNNRGGNPRSNRSYGYNRGGANYRTQSAPYSTQQNKILYSKSHLVKKNTKNAKGEEITVLAGWMARKGVLMSIVGRPCHIVNGKGKQITNSNREIANKNGEVIVPFVLNVSSMMGKSTVRGFWNTSKRTLSIPELNLIGSTDGNGTTRNGKRTSGWLTVSKNILNG